MEKSRIVAVLRQARGLRKQPSAKTVISARLAVRKNMTNSAKPLNALKQVTEGVRVSSNRAAAGEATPSEAITSEAITSQATRSEMIRSEMLRSEMISRGEAAPPGASPFSPE